uniref:MYND-type domain-containing protein n=1 Tax=viral metagenome TaxID=1070528 RepID=A0A6C0I1F9_9ZZZZ
MDSDRTTENEELLQDFWKRIKDIKKVFRKKDIKKLYKGIGQPLSESQLGFLYEKYNDRMSEFLSSTDDPDSVYNPDRYRSSEEKEIVAEDLRDIIRKLHTLGLINSCMSRMEALAIVMKYKDSKCFICEEIAPLCCSCKAVKYCSKACQKSDWKNHKELCTAKKK